jgi:hypothetical protein
VTAPGHTVDSYVFDDLEDAPRPVVVQGVFSIGAYLSAQRRQRGLSLDELEAVTRIPRRSLARLESGAFDRQQDAFVRGFVRTVALAIGLDPGETLVRMLTGEAPPRAGNARIPLRSLSIGLGGAIVLVVLLGLGLAAAGRIHVPRAERLIEPSESVAIVRRDFVREFAQLVRNATPGSFARAVAVAPPPAMYVAPAAASADDAGLGGVQ